MYKKIILITFAILTLSGCASFQQGTGYYQSEKMGMITPDKSESLQSKAIEENKPVSTIIPMKSPEQLNNYKTLFNTTFVRATFPMDQNTANQFRDDVAYNLKKSERVKIVTIGNGELGLYMLVSVKKVSQSKAVIELVTAVADWNEVAKLQKQNIDGYLQKATTWFIVSRIAVNIDEITSNGNMSPELISYFMNELNSIAVKNLLSPTKSDL